MNEPKPRIPSQKLSKDEFGDLVTRGDNNDNLEGILKGISLAPVKSTNPNINTDGSASESRDSLVAAFGVPDEGTPEYAETQERLGVPTEVQQAVTELRPQDVIGPSGNTEDYDRVAAAAASGNLEGLSDEEVRLAGMLRNASEGGEQTVQELHQDIADPTQIDLRAS